MGEAWIIDGARSPRGKGKSNGSLHHIHPQELLAQTLNALADRTGIDTHDVDDVIIGNGNPSGDHGACIGRMSRARRRLAGRGAGRHAQPILRIGPAGHHVRGDGHPGRAPADGGRRRRRVDVALDRRRRAARLHVGQRRAARDVPARPPGHLGRPDRHHRGVQPRRRRRVRCREPEPRRQGDGRGCVRSQRRAHPQPRRLGGARRRRVPAPGEHRRRHSAG